MASGFHAQTPWSSERRNRNRDGDGRADKFAADISVAITGIAGPGGGTKRKPVGLVHFAAASRDGKRRASPAFWQIGRRRVRERSVAEALELLEFVAQ